MNMATEPLTFAERLRVHREAAGLSQEELAAKLSLSVSLIAKMEQGRRPNPTLSTLHALASALGVTVGDLAGEPPESGKRSRKRKEG
jgi:transcriptional regulator with XRE-family HTH domain